MTNVERLVEEGVIESADHLSPDHTTELNSFTSEEIDGIIKLKMNIIGQPLSSFPDKTGGAFL